MCICVSLRWCRCSGDSFCPDLSQLGNWLKVIDQPRQHIKKQRQCLANKGVFSQSYGFSSRHVWMWELDYKESWMSKNWCSNCGVGENSWESLELQGDPASPSKGNQSRIFIGRTDAETETPILWPPDVKNWFIGKDPDAGKDWGQED